PSALPSDSVQGRAAAPGMDIKTLIHMDGDEHRATRRITNDWFRPASLRQKLEGTIAGLARRYVDRMLELGGACDFSADVALYYPLHVIMSVLGVPESDEPRMLKLTHKLFGAGDPDFGGSDGGQAQLAALMDFYTYFNQITVDRRAHPTIDIASTIANAQLDDLSTISYY